MLINYNIDVTFKHGFNIKCHHYEFDLICAMMPLTCFTTPIFSCLPTLKKYRGHRCSPTEPLMCYCFLSRLTTLWFMVIGHVFSFRNRDKNVRHPTKAPQQWAQFFRFVLFLLCKYCTTSPNTKWKSSAFHKKYKCIHIYSVNIAWFSGWFAAIDISRPLVARSWYTRRYCRAFAYSLVSQSHRSLINAWCLRKMPFHEQTSALAQQTWRVSGNSIRSFVPDKI